MPTTTNADVVIEVVPQPAVDYVLTISTTSPGPAGTVAVGTTTTGAPGTSAAVTNTGTPVAAVLNFTIPRGDTGATGSSGAAATIAVGTTTTGAAGSAATVTNSGTSSAAVFNFSIPQGVAGSAGTAATIAVGTTTTGAPGSSASVTNSGTSSAAVFNFTVPQGPIGATGATGSAATVNVGTTTTGAAGSSASVTNSGTSSAAVLNFVVPQGAAGVAGAAGTPGSVWYTASGVPSSGLGINGDYYLNSANGDVYLKTSGSWAVVANIKGATGPGGALGYYGAFQDTTTQTIASTTTAYPITLNTTDEFNGVTRGTPTSKIVFANAGTYDIEWSGQFENTDTVDADARIWLRKNGTDISGTSGIISIPSKHGGVNGHVVSGWNYVLTLAANDYLELVWQASSTTVSLAYYAGGSSPTSPAAASMIVTATQVMYTQLGNLADGDKGEVTVSSSGATWTIDSGVVSTSKMGVDVTTSGKSVLTATSPMEMIAMKFLE